MQIRVESLIRNADVPTHEHSEGQTTPIFEHDLLHACEVSCLHGRGDTA